MRSDRVLAKKQQTIRPFDAIKYGICANCPAGCGVKAFMNGTTPVDFFGDEEHPLNKGSLCPKGFVLYVAHDHKAVSYTHLDVYKRQSSSQSREGWKV